MLQDGEQFNQTATTTSEDVLPPYNYASSLFFAFLGHLFFRTGNENNFLHS